MPTVRADEPRELPRLLALGCLAAIALGVALRVAGFFLADLWIDGDVYAAMGRALADHGSFLLPSGDWASFSAQPGFSHHMAPLYPLYLATWYKVAGFSPAVTKVASIAMSLAALLGAHLLARDLVGPRALLVTAGLALDPQLVWVTATGFSENLVLLLFAVTIWAIVRSLDDPRFIVLAGLAAGLAYLSRASIGVFFVVAGLGGLAWRFHYVRWAVFTDRAYLAAVAIFGLVVLGWTWRNVSHFGWGGWQTSAYTAAIQACILRDLLGACAWPGQGPAAASFALALAAKVPLFAAFFALWAVPFWPEIRASVAKLRDQRESALWLAVVLVAVLGWLAAAMFWTAEDSSLWWPDNRRYMLIAGFPLLLAVARHARLDGDFTRRAGAFLAAFAVLSLAVFALPPRFPEVAATQALAPELRPGDDVGYDGALTKYASFAYLPADAGKVCTFYASLVDPASCHPRFLLSTDPGLTGCHEDNGFERRPDLEQRQEYRLPGWTPRAVSVWERVREAPLNTARCYP